MSGPTAGTIKIDPGGDQPATNPRTTTGGVTGAGGTPHAATFFTYGGARQTFSARRAEAIILLRRDGGSETMRLEPLTLNGPVNRVLTQTGVLELRVGGTLTVGANQAEGTYRGTFTLVVDYQ